MSKITKMYKSFFGLKESTNLPNTPAGYQELQAAAQEYAETLKGLEDTMKGLTEDELSEAELTNQINDYRGGVVYTLLDASQADVVAKTIYRWTTKKGFTLIKHEKSPRGTRGYFYFRLGNDPYAEAQRIQGYFAQLPVLKHFSFQVLDSAPVPKKKKPRPNI